MFVRTVAMSIAATVLAAGAVHAEAPLPVLTASYSADRIIETEAGTFTGKVYATPERDRSEMSVGEMSTVIILRRDLQNGLMLMPSQKMFRELDFSEARKQTGAAPADVTIDAVGPDTIDTVATTKYKLVMKDGSAGGFIWFTDEGIPVKMDMLTKSGKKTERMTVTLRNLQVGPQDPALFDAPAGYTKMPGFPGMKGFGGFGGFGRKRSTN
jgi:hypothetical protein